MTPETADKETPERILTRIKTLAMDSLDPELTREALARRMKDVWVLADQGDDEEDDDDEAAENS